MVAGTETVPIARSPRDVVYSRDHLTLYRYRRETPARYATPLLLVYSLINKPTVLDLLPKRSVVEHFVNQGFEVYLLDWGIPDAMDQHVSVELHVDLLLRTAVREVCRHAGSEQVSLLGYCMGGTLAAIYASRHPRRIQNLILLGAPVNYRSSQKLYQWGCDPEFFNPQEVVDAFGNVPSWFFEGFNMLAPGAKLPRLASLYEGLDNPAFVESFLAMDQWVNDNIPMAGATYAEHIRTCWQDNQLWEGRLELGGRPVRLEDIDCPVLIIVGESDHLVPAETAAPLAERLRDARVILFPSGHVGLSVSGNSHKKLWPQVSEWLGERSRPIS